MDPPAKTDAVRVCLDADVVIAGLFSRDGASHALLVLAEMGLVALVLPRAGVEEIRRNLEAKLPEALPLFERVLEAPWVEVHAPRKTAMKAARDLAHAKDVPILAAALSSGATILVTHNTRHFRSTKGLRVLRPAALLREVRAWMTQFGR